MPNEQHPTSATPAPVVRFCVNNPRTIEERRALIAQGFDCRDCLSNCAQCFETRFLEVGGEIVAAETETGTITDQSYDELLEIASRRAQTGDANTGPNGT